MGTPLESIPGLSRPLRDALAGARYSDLESLDGAEYSELIKLHGVGRAGLIRLHETLREKGMGLQGSVPTRPSATFSSGHTGRSAKDIKTAPTDSDPATWIESLPWPRRVMQGKILLELFNEVTGSEPVMWGPSVIGYGEVHYRYATGREGDTFGIGFSPRRASLSLYGLQGHPRSDEILERLGRHRRAVGCIYITSLESVDIGVLGELVEHAWTSAPSSSPAAD